MKKDIEFEAELWAEYKADPSQINEHLIFEYYYDMAIQIAARYINSHSCSRESDEIKQSALIGMLDAIKKYDPTKSSFHTYCNRRVYFSIIDYLRQTGKDKPRSKYNIVQLSLDSMISDDEDYEFDIKDPKKTYSEQIVERKEIIDIIYNSKLEQREKNIAKLLFVNNYNHGQIGEVIGLASSRINQLINKVIFPLIRQELIENHREMVELHKKRQDG